MLGVSQSEVVSVVLGMMVWMTEQAEPLAMMWAGSLASA
jgi:hypothetical protein